MAEPSSLKPKEVYTIFCSPFRYEPLSGTHTTNDLIPWQAHTFQDNTENTDYNEETQRKSEQLHQDYQDYFYPAFAECVLGQSSSLPRNLLPSYTKPLNKSLPCSNYEVLIKYADYFIYPHNIGIAAFKVCYPEDISFDDLTNLINKLRSMDFEQLLFQPNTLPFKVTDPLINGNKLKSFTIAEHDLDFTGDYSSDHLLFDIATCSPVGSAAGKGKIPSLKPSKEYYNQLINENKISIFENWSALALFDTFTLLHKGSIYNYNWETKYFRFLYVNTLFIKNYLIELNNIFHDQGDDNVLEEEFYNFDRDFNFDQISFNFLPQIIYEKIRHSQNLDQEITKLQTAIDRDTAIKEKHHNKKAEENEKRINTALLIVAFLAVVSAVWDGSEWAATVIGIERSENYSLFSGIFMIVVIISISIILLAKKNGRKNKKR